MTMFTNRCSRQLRKWRAEFASSFKIFLMLFCVSSFFTTGVFGQGPGTAPVVPPIGGMRIDGFLGRQGTAGDWFAGPGGSGAGTFFFNANGTSQYPNLLNKTLFWKTDAYKENGTTFNGPEDRFTQGSKLNQDPNDWTWDANNPQGKDDINNAFFALVQNPADGHWWALMAGDRAATNGTSYLDFEFLQAPITKNANFTFTSSGPDSGRTVGDLDVTLSYTGGGSLATASVFQWNPLNDGTFAYTSLTPAAGTVFVQPNETQPTPFPGTSGAFGLDHYTDSLQFVEGALDITALLGTGISTPCRALPFTSVFIKTVSSAQTTAEMKDFIAPFSINICTDNTPPTITTSGTPTNGQLGCNPTTAAINAALGSATATDNCSTPTVTSSDGSVSSSGCSRSQTRTFTATDGCGNTATASRTATWTVDVTAPTITATGDNTSLGCNPSTAAINGALGSASATDACSTPTVTSSDGAVSSDGCSRSQTRTFTATDACGNTATASRTATWTSDLTPPTITATGDNPSLGCNPSTAAIDGALGSASATDNCGTATVTHTDGTIGTDGCSRSQTRTFTATDGCGNTATTSRTATWTFDQTPPTITATGTDLNLCNPSTAQIEAALGSATATDGCGATTVTQSDGAITGDCAKSQTRTFTATDACGNTATTSRTVTWSSDNTPPTITASGTPADGVLGCNPTTADIEAALGSASATDNCGTPTVTPSDGSVSSDGCLRSQTRTFTATDACGNTATTSRTATWTEDVTAPDISATGNALSLGCNPSTASINGALGSASATDACSTPTVTSSDGSVSSDGCSRSQTRTFTATDACGNTATASRTATWTEDHTPPTITCPADATVACGTTVVFGTPTATDNCDATPTINDLGDGTPVTNSDGSVTYSHSWSASDDCGNTSSSCTQHITVSTCGAGCTIGFWKNHTDIWDGISPDLPGLPFTTGSNFRTYFGITNDCNVPASAVTMIQVLNLNGGGCRALARQAIAAALNESILSNYDYPGGITQLKADVAAAFNGGCNCSALNTTLSNLNNREGTSCSALLTQTTIALARPTAEQNSLVKDLSVTAYPNPYTDKVNFVIASTVSGQATLEIYNMLGQKMQTVYKGHVFAGKRETVEYKVPMTSRTNLIYILRMGDRVVTGKLLSLE